MPPISRRQFLGSASMAAIGVTGMAGLAHAWNVPIRREDVVVETAYGRVRGARENGVSIFRGIPYAGRVSGDRRFRRPAPLEPWTGVRDALALGPPAIQPGRQATATEPAPAEDCLVLNVWTPATDGGRRPVMFYSHGGGFVIGSGGSRGQDGANLARNFDVVVVQTNHRLGLLGFLYLDELGGEPYAGSGNNGILDIVDGLSWVQQNIAAFGGDPANVMIWGESGGGAKTSALYAMPAAAPYFNKASIESGPGVRMMARETAAETTSRVLAEANLGPGEWRRLLELGTAELLALQEKFSPVPPDQTVRPRNGGGPLPIGFSPVVDGITLPNHPFEPAAPDISQEKPLITGWNEDEYTFFANQQRDTSWVGLDLAGLRAKLEPRFGGAATRIVEVYRESRPSASPADIYVAVQSVAMMGFGAIEIAERKAAQRGAPVYLYNFGYKSDATVADSDYPMGAAHAADIAFKFNNVAQPERQAASRNFAEFWTTFARSGTPSASGQPAWPSFDTDTRPVMRIDTECEVIRDRHAEEREMWRSLGYIG